MSDGLLSALLAVQQEAPTLPKDGRNPAFGGSSYVKLDTIVERIGPILASHGLVWMTKPSTDDQGEPVLRYTLAHVPSGEREEGQMRLLLTKDDPQGQGSAITYARRYSLCAVLNLVADEDDDGNAGSSGQSRPRTTAGRVGKATEAQLRRVKKDIKGLSWGEIRATFAQAGVTVDDPSGIDGLSRVEASAVIDRLAQGALPSENASDVPSDASEFQHEAVTPEEIAEAFEGAAFEATETGE